MEPAAQRWRMKRAWRGAGDAAIQTKMGRLIPAGAGRAATAPPPTPEELELEREMEYFVEPEEAFTRDEIE